MITIRFAWISNESNNDLIPMIDTLYSIFYIKIKKIMQGNFLRLFNLKKNPYPSHKTLEKLQYFKKVWIM